MSKGINISGRRRFKWPYKSLDKIRGEFDTQFPSSSKTRGEIQVQYSLLVQYFADEKFELPR